MQNPILSTNPSYNNCEHGVYGDFVWGFFFKSSTLFECYRTRCVRVTRRWWGWWGETRSSNVSDTIDCTRRHKRRRSDGVRVRPKTETRTYPPCAICTRICGATRPTVQTAQASGGMDENRIFRFVRVGVPPLCAVFGDRWFSATVRFRRPF